MVEYDRDFLKAAALGARIVQTIHSKEGKAPDELLELVKIYLDLLKPDVILDLLEKSKAPTVVPTEFPVSHNTMYTLVERVRAEIRDDEQDTELCHLHDALRTILETGEPILLRLENR